MRLAQIRPTRVYILNIVGDMTFNDKIILRYWSVYPKISPQFCVFRIGRRSSVGRATDS